jgi:hypothetical protein
MGDCRAIRTRHGSCSDARPWLQRRACGDPARRASPVRQSAPTFHQSSRNARIAATPSKVPTPIGAMSKTALGAKRLTNRATSRTLATEIVRLTNSTRSGVVEDSSYITQGSIPQAKWVSYGESRTALRMAISTFSCDIAYPRSSASCSAAASPALPVTQIADRNRAANRRLIHACYHNIMRQLTLRVPEELAERLKGAAHDRGESVNGYAVKVLSAAVDPDLAGDEVTGLKERLARAGLLLTPELLATKRHSARELSRARAAAGRGKPLSDFVAEGRR